MSRWRKKIQKLRNGGLRQLLHELSWIGSYTYRYRKAVLWYICLGVLSTAMGLGASVLSKNIVDAVTGYSGSALLPAAVFYVGMQLLRIGINAWSGRISAKIEAVSYTHLRAHET